jgi:enoyl-[acyl-carrier protein] reductase II
VLFRSGGDTEEGELEIGQVSSIINEVKPAAEVVKEIWEEFKSTAANPFMY